MVTTESKARVKRVPIREFRASLRADMELPLIVTADGAPMPSPWCWWMNCGI